MASFSRGALYGLLLTAITSLAFCAPATNEPRASRFTYYDMITPLSLPCDVTLGPDGNEWAEELAGNNLVRIDIKTGKVTEYPIPFTVPALNVSLPKIPGTDNPALSCAIYTAPDGNLYASNGDRNQVVKMEFPSHKVSVFSAPAVAGNLQPLNDMTPGPHGLFFTQTTANLIGHFDYKTHKFRNFAIPTPASGPVGIYYASDGGVWFLELFANKVGRFDPVTHAFEEISLPPALFGPVVMRAETDGRYLWFAAILGQSIGRVDMRTRAVKAFPVPLLPELLPQPVEVCASDNGDIWFTELSGAYLGRLRPSTGKFEEVKLPAPVVEGAPAPFVGSGIYCKPGRNIWFSEANANRVVKYSLAR